MLGRKSKLSQHNKRTIYKICIWTVLTYAFPIFAHAAPKTLDRLQVIHNKFCGDATDAHWCVRMSMLYRNLKLPIIAKYMKNASKRFFDIARSHSNALSLVRQLITNHLIIIILFVGHETYLPIHLTLLQRK
ncbi:Probable RNA-directed DNA polymerase from transposon BS [Eumeta japonica]|uniref:Probable RNA-directed DNA polymerase from transposon BS n=1 Tax=Eumeta variegata TaxID=151549 RepID=A0A4C1XU22_EUMVA|nr:Probable RNA-directed DNA polymerase from transposon BS [Eumeta japonica]